MSFFYSSRRRHTRWPRDWSSDVCSSDLGVDLAEELTDESDYLNDYFIVNSVSGRGIISEENEVIQVTGMNGAHAASSRTLVRYLDVTITAKGNNENSLHNKLEWLDEWIMSGRS